MGQLVVQEHLAAINPVMVMFACADLAASGGQAGERVVVVVAKVRETTL